MNPLNIAIIIFSVFVLISFALYFVFIAVYLKVWNLYPEIFHYVAQLFMFIGSIMLIVAASCKLSNSVYRGALALLYIGDILSLAALFAFAFWPVGYSRYVYAAGVFNWAALVAFLIIIPLIVLVHAYLIKNSNNQIDNIAILPNEAPLQPTYQNY